MTTMNTEDETSKRDASSSANNHKELVKYGLLPSSLGQGFVLTVHVIIAVYTPLTIMELLSAIR